MACLGLLPESPRGLTTRGKYLPARIALQRLHPRDDQDSNQARLEVILSEVESVRGQTRLRHVIQSPNLVSLPLPNTASCLWHVETCLDILFRPSLAEMAGSILSFGIWCLLLPASRGYRAVHREHHHQVRHGDHMLGLTDGPAVPSYWSA